jgi:hypothetical protein
MPDASDYTDLAQYLKAFPGLRTAVINSCSLIKQSSLLEAFQKKGRGFLQFRPYLVEK